jgi:molybdopterin synthase catalytic subunit
MAHITVLFFATLKVKAGTGRVEMEVADQTTIGDLKAELGDRFPDVQTALAHSLSSVNQQYAMEEDVVPDGAEVAFFPPVSGGSAPPTVVAVTREPFDLDAILAQITLPSTGAGCLFTGMVRGVTTRGHAHETTMLEYEAYEPMAEEKMRQVADEIRANFTDIEGVAIIQRIGQLVVETPTVVVACTASHRNTGVFEAARYGIDRLKEIVPIWKKEVGPDGEVWVEGDYYPQPGE